jgi:hypothetical protein
VDEPLAGSPDRTHHAPVPRLNPELRVAIARATQAAGLQEGAITTAHARSLGVPDDAIGRLVDRGRWQRIHRGVLVVTTDRPALATRMWAAHLALGPRSVIGGTTAGRAWGLVTGAATPGEPVTVVMPDSSSRSALAGRRATRVDDVHRRASGRGSPAPITRAWSPQGRRTREMPDHGPFGDRPPPRCGRSGRD